MGSEDLFHKRRKKTQKKLQRSRAKQSSYDRVLIVCEGEKTEPNYLNELIGEFRLNSANIKVDGSSDSSPDRVWVYAKRLYQKSVNQGDAYDRVYCVFDQDQHAHYQRTIEEINRSKPVTVFRAITSVPCFEYWLLLHWRDSARPYYSVEGKSSCDGVLAELKRQMPDYCKGDTGLFVRLRPQMEQAISWSEKVLKQGRREGSDNPSTLMHELVVYLRELKIPKEPNT